jgi:hypothetical protein
MSVILRSDTMIAVTRIGDLDNCLAVTLASVDCIVMRIDLFLFCSVLVLLGYKQMFLSSVSVPCDGT